MDNFFHPILIGLSPNAQSDDVIVAFKELLRPNTWTRSEAVRKVEFWLKNYFAAQEVVTFSSARVALGYLLKSFEIGTGDEVIIQAFSCVAVAASVKFTGASPVFADIDETLNIDPNQLERLINKNTKAIILQHTFGISADIEAITKITTKHKLLLIEDCAHGFGQIYKDRRLGSFGDSAVVSFGRDKVVSSVWGGAAVINSGVKDANSKHKLREYQKALPLPSRFWIFRQLLHPIVCWLIKPIYNLQIGKVILVLLQKFHLLSFPVTKSELDGSIDKELLCKYPNSLAMLLLNQLSKLDKIIKQRAQVVEFYKKNLPKNLWSEFFVKENKVSGLMRFPISVFKRDEIFQKAKRMGVVFGAWYANVIDPKGVSYEAIGYSIESCPRAERVAKYIINLPTTISLNAAQRIVNLVVATRDQPL